jgi:putative FmdB family regulatory protein
MPLYEYACQKCEHTFTELVYDGDAVECPECKSRELERLMSVPARPQTGSSGSALPMAACNTPGPPCGAPWCQRKG